MHSAIRGSLCMLFQIICISWTMCSHSSWVSSLGWHKDGGDSWVRFNPSSIQVRKCIVSTFSVTILINRENYKLAVILPWIYSRRESSAASLESLSGRSDSISSSSGRRISRQNSRSEFNPIPEDNISAIENINAPQRPSLYRSVRSVLLGLDVMKHMAII